MAWRTFLQIKQHFEIQKKSTKHNYAIQLLKMIQRGDKINLLKSKDYLRQKPAPHPTQNRHSYEVV